MSGQVEYTQTRSCLSHNVESRAATPTFAIRSRVDRPHRSSSLSVITHRALEDALPRRRVEDLQRNEMDNAIKSSQLRAAVMEVKCQRLSRYEIRFEPSAISTISLLVCPTLSIVCCKTSNLLPAPVRRRRAWMRPSIWCLSVYLSTTTHISCHSPPTSPPWFQLSRGGPRERRRCTGSTRPRDTY